MALGAADLHEAQGGLLAAALRLGLRGCGPLHRRGPHPLALQLRLQCGDLGDARRGLCLRRGRERLSLLRAEDQ